MRVLSLAAAILVLAAPAQAVPAQQGPEAFVRWVYRHYPLPDPMPFEVLGKDAPRLFDGPMVTLIRRDQKLAGDDLPALDFDPICQCQDDPSPHVRPSDCVTARVRAMEDASGQKSKIRAEVPYDVSKDPPAPIMSKNDPRRATRGKPKDSQVPDIVVVEDENKPATQDNLEEVIEIKYPPDKLSDQQRDQYRRIAGNAPFEVFGPERCRCPGPTKKPKPVANEEIIAAAALTLLLLALLMARQGPAASRVKELSGSRCRETGRKHHRGRGMP